MKKLTRVLIALVLVLSLSFSLIACKKGGETSESLAGTYKINVWVADAAIDLTKKQIADFNESQYAKDNGIVVEATIDAKSEANAGTDFIAVGVEQGPDIYTFAQDQFARLVQAGGLSKLGVKASETVTAANDPGVVSAGKSGDALYAYPMTSDNGYFMYYDKSVVAEEHINSLEDIIEDCKKASKNFSFELESSAWYAAGFFFGVGCVSEWKTDDKAKFIDVKDDFYSEKGLIAAKGMKKLLDFTGHVNSSAGNDFDNGSAVVVTGTWAFDTISTILGDNLGCAKLPCYTVDGKQYQIGSFNGCKLMGVKPQTSSTRSAVCHALAQFLTDYDRQVERFNTLAWGPANLEAQKLDAVKANPGLAALLAQNAYSVPQGQIHGSWWDLAKVIATDIKDSDGTDAGLMAALKKYDDAIKALFTMSDEEKNAWTVIGSMNEDGWKTDLAMEKQTDGSWKSKDAITFVAGDAFKVRQGKDWTNAFGDSTTASGNYEVATAGTFYVVLTYEEGEEGPTNGVITLVAA